MKSFHQRRDVIQTRRDSCNRTVIAGGAARSGSVHGTIGTPPSSGLPLHTNVDRAWLGACQLCTKVAPSKIGKRAQSDRIKIPAARRWA
ncbi:hypothetical protein N7481_005832 [Penicillium waksmanii]|uniref:uncharacterized protein n=1 Tax=Penicillium waksmanii TaxID=69791 RepID=UPI002546EC7D|nr:uncharacterized protein N7481_005832 [Penicillium waksmanii]KAJ5983733.1 hypothetical protein N7481_005832 [Penicillium waksmanii]